MKTLKELPNIGKSLSQKLQKCNINTPNDLKSIGSRTAFTKILLIDQEACINVLYALEGAVKGVRWHHLDNKEKAELKVFYQTIKG